MTKLLAIFLLSLPLLSYAPTAFFVREGPVEGLTKVCFYNYAGSVYTLTVKSHELCPMSIYVD